MIWICFIHCEYGKVVNTFWSSYPRLGPAWFYAIAAWNFTHVQAWLHCGMIVLALCSFARRLHIWTFGRPSDIVMQFQPETLHMCKLGYIVAWLCWHYVVLRVSSTFGHLVELVDRRTGHLVDSRTKCRFGRSSDSVESEQSLFSTIDNKVSTNTTKLLQN
jgi:hypothetical protein